MTEDHKQIWLEPKSADYGSEGRLWCEDPVWDDGVLFLRADVVEEQTKRLRKELALWRSRFDMYRFDGKNIVPKRDTATG